MAGQTVAVSDTSFKQEVLEHEGAVLVDFWASWCGPCRMIAPILDEIASEEPRLKVAKVDIDQNPSIAREFQVMSIPTLAVFKGGEVVDVLVGARPKAAIEAAVRPHL